MLFRLYMYLLKCLTLWRLLVSNKWKWQKFSSDMHFNRYINKVVINIFYHLLFASLNYLIKSLWLVALLKDNIIKIKDGMSNFFHYYHMLYIFQRENAIRIKDLTYFISQWFYVCLMKTNMLFQNNLKKK